jgi:hypothetical protein
MPNYGSLCLCPARRRRVIRLACRHHIEGRLDEQLTKPHSQEWLCYLNPRPVRLTSYFFEQDRPFV